MLGSLARDLSRRGAVASALPAAAGDNAFMRVAALPWKTVEGAVPKASALARTLGNACGCGRSGNFADTKANIGRTRARQVWSIPCNSVDPNLPELE